MRTGAALAMVGCCVLACGHGSTRELRGHSRSAAKAVRRGDKEALRAEIVPAARARVDVGAVLKDGDAWAPALKKPEQIRPEAVVFLAPDRPTAAVWTDGGWRFAEDPSNLYSQATPRRALRALVRASRAGRWDVMIRLAPRRYRIGLAEEDLERAWTQGEQAKALREARARLADHLADPIVFDAHEAVLDMGEGNVARLEREGRRWVVVDF